MLQIEWREELRIDGGTIDQEHRSLLKLANQVFAIANPGAQLEEVIELVQSLFRYINSHFDHEEGLMAGANYVGLADHMLKHRQIRSKLAQAVRSQKDIALIGQYVQHLMLDWVVQHILHEDMRFRDFLDHGHPQDVATAESTVS